MKKLILSTAIALTLSGCVAGPPPDNERDRRAYGSLQDVDRHEDHYHSGHGYYDNHNNWHDDDDRDDDLNDYNVHTGQDHWAKHDSK